MTNINLLNDITQKSKVPQKSRSGVFQTHSKKPKISPPSPAAQPAEKPKKPLHPTSALTAWLLFLLPIVACTGLEGMLEDWMQVSVQKIAQKLDEETLKFQAETKDFPALETWEKRHTHLDRIHQELARIAPLDVQITIEFIHQLTDALPKEAWVKQVFIQRNPDLHAYALTLEGFAFTSETVLLFLSNLKAHPLFHDVELIFSKPTTENGFEEHLFRFSTTFPDANLNALGVSNMGWLYNRLYPRMWGLL